MTATALMQAQGGIGGTTTTTLIQIQPPSATATYDNVPLSPSSVVMTGALGPGQTFHPVHSTTTICSSPAPRQPCAIPYPQNKDFVLRPNLVAQVDVLLPFTSEFNSAALWGLGGSGYVLSTLFNPS